MRLGVQLKCLPNLGAQMEKSHFIFRLTVLFVVEKKVACMEKSRKLYRKQKDV